MEKPFRFCEIKKQFAKGKHSVPISKSSSTAHHRSMGKQGKENQENKSKETTETFSRRKDVIITVYVESPLPPPPPIHVHQKGSTRDTCKKSKPFSKSTGGYDRRAQLLAYAKERRNGDREQPQRPKNIPKPKQKKGGKNLKYSGENPRHHKKPKEILAISAGRGHTMQTKIHYWQEEEERQQRR